MFWYDSADYLIYTVHLPIIFQVEKARKERPYLGLRLNRDPSLIASVMMESGIETKKGDTTVKAIDVSSIDADMLDAVIRLVRLSRCAGWAEGPWAARHQRDCLSTLGGRTDKSRGGRLLGYANPREHEICICALPPRVSMTQALVPRQSPELFGAVRGKQWPELAVRRFLLYDVLLHELGHLQMVILNRKSGRRACARETRAQQFAEYWRKRLWASRLDHPDPVHNPPSLEESSGNTDNRVCASFTQ